MRLPFADGVEEAARAGATGRDPAGGSVRDADVIAAADRLGLAMVFHRHAPFPPLARFSARATRAAARGETRLPSRASY